MIHQIVKATVATTGAFDSIFKKMDDFMGYGDTSFNQTNNPLTGLQQQGQRLVGFGTPYPRLRQETTYLIDIKGGK